MPLSIFYKLVCIIAVVSLASCTPQAEVPPTPESVKIYAAPSAETWLYEAYDCAKPSGIVIVHENSKDSADIVLRVGEPNNIGMPSYQIGSDDILIVTHRQSPVQNMSANEVRALFAGQSGLDVQIWVYAEGDEVQQIFNDTIMQGTAITSQAMIAVDIQQMSDTLNNTINAVGILPRTWKLGDSRYVYTIANVPILALVNAEPQGAVKEIVACLQK